MNFEQQDVDAIKDAMRCVGIAIVSITAVLGLILLLTSGA